MEAQQNPQANIEAQEERKGCDSAAKNSDQVHDQEKLESTQNPTNKQSQQLENAAVESNVYFDANQDEDQKPFAKPEAEEGSKEGDTNGQNEAQRQPNFDGAAGNRDEDMDDQTEEKKLEQNDAQKEQVYEERKVAGPSSGAQPLVPDLKEKKARTSLPDGPLDDQDKKIQGQKKEGKVQQPQTESADEDGELPLEKPKLGTAFSYEEIEWCEEFDDSDDEQEEIVPLTNDKDEKELVDKFCSDFELCGSKIEKNRPNYSFDVVIHF